MTIDFTATVKNLRGQQYIDMLRDIAVLSAASTGVMNCGGCGKNPAQFIAMQACGTPGGPVCQACVNNQREWMDSVETIANAHPYCRHCGNDVDRSHIYVVSLYSRNNERIAV